MALILPLINKSTSITTTPTQKQVVVNPPRVVDYGKNASGGSGGGGGSSFSSSSPALNTPAGVYMVGGQPYSYGVGQAPGGAFYVGPPGTVVGGGSSPVLQPEPSAPGTSSPVLPISTPIDSSGSQAALARQNLLEATQRLARSAEASSIRYRLKDINTLLENVGKKIGKRPEDVTPSEFSKYVEGAVEEGLTQRIEIKEVPTGQTITDTSTGQQIPITKYVVTDLDTGQQRIATPQEYSQLQRVEVASSEKVNIPFQKFKEGVLGVTSRIGRGFRETDIITRERFTQPAIDVVKKYTGIDITSPKTYSITPIRAITPIGSSYIEKEYANIQGVIGSTIAKDILYKPATNLAILGSSMLVGEMFGAGKELYNVYREGGVALGIPTGYELGQGYIRGGKIFGTLEEVAPKLSFGKVSFVGGKTLLTLKETTPTNIKIAQKIPSILGGGLIAGDIGLQLATSKSLEQAVERLTITGKDLALIGIGFQAGVLKSTKPFISRSYPGRVESKFVQFGVPRTINDKQIVEFTLNIESKAYPPLIEITSPTRSFFGLKPIRELAPYGETKISTLKTMFPSIAEEDYIAIETTEKSVKLATISGGEIPTELKQYISYPEIKKLVGYTGEGEIIGMEKTQRLPFEVKPTFVEEITPIQRKLTMELVGISPEEFLAKLISEKQMFTIGEVSETKLFKKVSQDGDKVVLKINEDLFERIPEGRRTRIYDYLAKTEQLDWGEASRFDIFKSELVFKDVTTPLPRAAGKPQRLKGITIISKEPISEQEIDRIIKIEPKDIQKLDLKANLDIVKPITQKAPSLRIVPSPKIKPQSIPTPSKVLSSEGITSTETIVSNAIKSGTTNIIRTRINERTIPAQRISPIQKSTYITKELLKEETLSKQLNKLFPREIERNREVNRLLGRQMEKQLQKELILEKTITKLPPPQRPPIRIPPFFKTPTILKVPRIPRSKKTKGITRVPTFSLLVKRRGRVRPVATGLTRGEALLRGSDIARSTLARTFKLVPTGEKELFGTELQFMPREEIFRQYKIRGGRRIQTPDQFIQRTSRNLQSKQEQLELAEARRLKKLIGF